MNQPSVCAILLTANRPEMARRAVECFRKQTYDNKRLLIYDTGRLAALDWHGLRDNEYFLRDIPLVIGQMRNRANGHSCNGEEPDILIHWDDDDYSHANRIAEQVALLQSTGADCVGYREMLFWRESVPGSLPHGLAEYDCGCGDCQGEAWLYSNSDAKYALGTSLCYWRRVWERKPFAATSQGEDEKFIRGLKVVSIPSRNDPEGQPRMIARIHSGNTSTAYRIEGMEREARRSVAPHWKRVPEWNDYCRGVMNG